MADIRHQTFSFHAGEMSPLAQGSTDQETFARSLETCRNWVTTPQGAVVNRPGLEHVGFDHMELIATFPIAFSASTLTDPVKITDVAHGLSDGDVVTIITTTSGDRELTGAVSEIRVVDVDNFFLVGVDGTGHTATQAGTYFVSIPSSRVRCIPFRFNSSDTYMMYFGENWMMPVKNGELVLESVAGTYSTGDAEYPSEGEPLRITQATPTDHGLWCNDDVFMGEMVNDVLAKDHGSKRYRAMVPLDPAVGGLISAITVNAAGDGKIEVSTGVDHLIFTGDRVVFDSIVGTLEPLLNEECFEVELVSSSSFFIKDRNGNFIDGTDFTGVFSSGTWGALDNTVFDLEGTGGNVSGAVTISGTKTFNRYFRLETPWASSDLPNFDYAQTADTITITCDGFRPRKLTRTADDDWSIEIIDFRPGIEPPGPLTEDTTGTIQQVLVTTVSLDTGEESFPREDWLGADATNKITWNAVDNAFEYNIYKRKTTDDNIGFVDVATRESFEVDTAPDNGDINTAFRPPYYDNPFTEKVDPQTITGITLARPSVVTTSADHNFVIGEFVRIEDCTTQPESSDRNYEVLSVPSTTTLGLRFTDSLGYSGVGTDGTIFRLGSTVNKQPTAVTRFQNRTVFASTLDNPQAVFMTGSGMLESFQRRIPQSDSDAISLEIQDQNLEDIRWLISMEDVICLTAGGAYALQDAGGILTPAGTVPVPQFDGATSISKPVRVGAAVIYGSQESSALFELIAVPTQGARSYRSANISSQAEHIFRGFTIEELAYARDPVNIIWGIRNDGTLIGLTRYRELEVIGWHRHDTTGNFESVGTVPETVTEADSVSGITEFRTSASYFSVKRKIDGVTRRYFERLHIHRTEEIRDAQYVDNSLRYEEKFPGTPDFNNKNPLRIIVGSSHTYEVGDQLDMEHEIDGVESFVAGSMDDIRFKVGAIGADYIEITDLDDVDFDGSSIFSDEITLFNTYRCFQTAQFFDHLVGQTVSILADGSVKTPQVVAVDGTLIFTDFHSKVVAGEPIEADLQTLNPDAPAGPFQSLQGSQLLITRANVLVKNTRGLLAGPSFTSLSTHNYRRLEAYGDPAQPFDGLNYLDVDSDINGGVLFLRQPDPLPATVISISLDLNVFTSGGS